jgi:hypothetical protein
MCQGLALTVIYDIRSLTTRRMKEAVTHTRSLTHTQTYTHTQTLSLTHSHTHTLSYTRIQTHTHTLAFSHAQTHSYAHTQRHTLTTPHTPTHMVHVHLVVLLKLDLYKICFEDFGICCRAKWEQIRQSRPDSEFCLSHFQNEWLFNYLWCSLPLGAGSHVVYVHLVESVNTVVLQKAIPTQIR